MATRLTSLDLSSPAIDLQSGIFTGRWPDILRLLAGDVAAFAGQAAIIASKTIAQANALGLGASDAGYLVRITDGFQHLLRWDGSAWQWGPGDEGNGRLAHFALTPASDLWALCDGSATTYLSGIGTATLAASAFTTPNPGSDRVLKTGAYTGTNVAAVAPGASAVLSGSTADESAHTHSGTGISEGSPIPNTDVDNNLDGSTVSVSTSLHVHTPFGGSTGAGTAHGHGAGTLAAAITVDATGAPASLAALLYFRR